MCLGQMEPFLWWPEQSSVGLRSEHLYPVRVSLMKMCWPVGGWVDGWATPAGSPALWPEAPGAAVELCGYFSAPSGARAAFLVQVGSLVLLPWIVLAVRMDLVLL